MQRTAMLLDLQLQGPSGTTEQLSRAGLDSCRPSSLQSLLAAVAVC